MKTALKDDFSIVFSIKVVLKTIIVQIKLLSFERFICTRGFMKILVSIRY